MKVSAEIVARLGRCFPKSFINEHEEFIAYPKTNLYFKLGNCETELDVKCKMLEWCSRDACKTEFYNSDSYNRRYQNMIRNSINNYLDTYFTKEQMYTIYTYLGNCCNHQLTIKFINSNYDFSLLREPNQEITSLLDLV